MEKTNSLVQQFFERAEAFMIAINRSGEVSDINAKGCQILGFPKAEIVGKNWFNIFVPEEKREDAKRLFIEMLNGPLPHMHREYPIVSGKGVERVFNWHNILSSDEEGDIIGVISSGDDVTERRQADKTSKEVESRLQISLDSVIEGYQIIDNDWRYVYLNEAAAKQGRRTKEELLGKTMMEAYPGIEHAQLFSHLRSCMTNRIPHSMENEFEFSDGSKGWFELRINPVPEGILILSLDITKSKENAAELNQYRQRLEEVVAARTSECIDAKEKLLFEIQEHKKMSEGLKIRAAILDKASEAIFLVNTTGDFAYANEAALETYGYSLEEILSLNLRALGRPEEVAEIETRLKKAVNEGKFEAKTVHLRKDKSEMQVQVRHSLIRTEHGQFIVTVVRDIISQ